jgi:hypothetical protein
MMISTSGLIPFGAASGRCAARCLNSSAWPESAETMSSTPRVTPPA